MTSGSDDIPDLESGPITPAETAFNFECEFTRMYAGREGIKITLNVHPEEPCLPALLGTKINSRLMVSAVVIGDDEQINPPRVVVQGIRAVRKAGILCRREDFHRFLVDASYIETQNNNEEYENAAASFVRQWCRVRSRGDIKYDIAAQNRLEELVADYQRWLKTNVAGTTSGGIEDL
jgi:hypothetical protein